MKRIIILLFTAILFFSCSWIEEDTTGQLVTGTIGDSKQDAQMLVTGVYSKWIYDMFCWGYFPRMLEFDGDYISGPDWLFGTFGAGNFQGEPDLVDMLWKGCYGLIGRANNAIRYIGTMEKLSESEKNDLIGQLRFQRAFAYFLLVRAYGAVPIQPESETFDRNVARQPVHAVYDYILSDLTEAAKMMYRNTDEDYECGHVNAGSAAGLLAKVYATMASASMPAGTEIIVRSGSAYVYDEGGNKVGYAPLTATTLYKQPVEGYGNMDSKSLWMECAKWCQALMNGTYGSFELLPYDILWQKSSATASEFLFSVGTVSGDATYKTSVHTQYAGYRTSIGSDFIQSGGWIGCTRHWYDLFDHDDYRITKGVKHRWRNYTQEESNSGFYYPRNDEYSILATGYNMNNEKVGSPQGIFADGVNYYYSYDSQCLAFTTKYEDVTNNSIENADANWPFLRYADVLLIYAEALNELDRPGDGIRILNMVQQRSNAVLSTMSGSNGLLTKTQRRSAIIEERAKELACEADRRWDLIRWGIYLDAMNLLGGSDDSGVNKNRTARNLLFPLPQQEINTNNAINDNNPGWQ